MLEDIKRGEKKTLQNAFIPFPFEEGSGHQIKESLLPLGGREEPRSGIQLKTTNCPTGTKNH